MSEPTAEPNPSDPGDITQQRFFYQHAYGVILFSGCIKGDLPYRALWCEQHEDFLGEISESSFDAIQVKTRGSAQSAWTLGAEDFQKAIKRFCATEEKFPTAFRRFVFVTNHPFEEPTKEEYFGKSPSFLIKECKNKKLRAALPKWAGDALLALATSTGTDPDKLFLLLLKTELNLGPSIDDMKSVVVHRHLASIPEIAHLPVESLNRLRDELIHKVYLGCALQTDVAYEHYLALLPDREAHPRLLGKKILLEEIKGILTENRPTFRYLPTSSILSSLPADAPLSVLGKKLAKGGIIDQFDTFRQRIYASQVHLLEVLHKSSEPDDFHEGFNRTNTLLKAEVDDIHASVSSGGGVYGNAMLSSTIKRCRELASARPSRVIGLPYECLMGMIACLTEECKVWWSEQFDLNKS